MFSTSLILHVDADAFFASVEQRLRPELRGKAVIVGGSDRGVVSAASYEARRFGVHSAMSVVQARRLCPHAVFLNPNFAAYSEFSGKMFGFMRNYSPAVEQTSVDEGYVDLTGTLRLHKAPAWEVAHRLMCEIRSELHINVSGGLAGTKTEAKMAAGLAKPNGLLYLDPHLAQHVLGGLPVASVPGVGKNAEEILRREGIRLVGELADAGPDRLRRLLGRWGEKLWETAVGRDSRQVRTEPLEGQKSYSKERTLAKDTLDYSFVRSVAREMGEKLAARVRADQQAATTVSLKIRYADFVDVTRSISFKEGTNGNREILECLDRLFKKTITRRTKIRQVGVKLSGIGQSTVQTDLFDPKRLQRGIRDGIVDTIRSRFGFHAVRVSG
ncbi:MAG: DNA polymerase IV [Desulfomonile tiedjei]|nr:DNA polymerase IV [Desulfomonile tiedjei]